MITFVANNGTSDSPIATSTVRYGNPPNPNTVPSVTLPSGNLSYREGSAPIAFAVGATLVDSDPTSYRSITWRLDGSSLSSVWLLNSTSAYSRSISLPSQSAEWSLQVTNPSALKKRFRTPVDLK